MIAALAINSKAKPVLSFQKEYIPIHPQEFIKVLDWRLGDIFDWQYFFDLK
jgi:hypothetical protein